jgi:hypothetical protein
VLFSQMEFLLGTLSKRKISVARNYWTLEWNEFGNSILIIFQE